jgi:hypothetical protein
MSRETPEAENPHQSPPVRQQQVDGERQALVAKLERAEQAYGELLERVQRYERERVEIKGRLRHILARLGGPWPT